MSEKQIYLEDIDPIHLYGVNNSKFKLLQQYFSKLKIIARGHDIKVVGESSDIVFFQEKIDLLLAYYSRFNSLTEDEIAQILEDDRQSAVTHGDDGSDVIVYGNHGNVIKAKTANQQVLVKAVEDNDLVFTIGPAGSGKTYTAIALAVRALKNKEIKRMIFTRPAVEAGEQLGFLPGDMKEKLDPYMQPIYDALYDMIPSKKLMEYLEDGTIQIAPLAFMRGRTLANAFVVLDEAQNATSGQLKMFLTRMGNNARFIVTGDITQVDLPYSKKSGLSEAINLLKDVEGIAIVEFDVKDIVRHRLVKHIVKAYDSIK